LERPIVKKSNHGTQDNGGTIAKQDNDKKEKGVTSGKNTNREVKKKRPKNEKPKDTELNDEIKGKVKKDDKVGNKEGALQPKQSKVDQ